MNSTNNISARASYDNALSIFTNAWVENFKGDYAAARRYAETRKLSQSEVRLEVVLNTTNTVFTFGVTPNQSNTTGVVFNTENRLQLQDSLVVSEYGIFVAQPASATDAAYRLNTFGNGNVFAAADATALNSTFYSNGFFSVKVNNDVVIPYRGIWNHFYIPQTQQIAALGATAVQNQVRGAEDGFVTAEPNLLLIGSKNTVPQINLPAALGSAAANLRCILILRGILAQNSTVVN